MHVVYEGQMYSALNVSGQFCCTQRPSVDAKVHPTKSLHNVALTCIATLGHKCVLHTDVETEWKQNLTWMAEFRKVGQFDLPAVSWQPGDPARRATNQTICVSTF